MYRAFTYPLYLAKSTNYESPHDVIFSILLLLPLTQVQIFFSAFCYQTLSILYFSKYSPYQKMFQKF
jgi:hypothetical protein